VLSAGWLHGNLLHIGFNLMWIRQLGPFAGTAFGQSRATILYLLSGIGGFAATTAVRSLVRFGGLGAIVPGPLVGADYTLGASAAIFGWIGALIYFGRRTGKSGLSSQLMWGAAVPLAVIGLIWPSVDNWAHFGGFATGYLGAMVLDPLKPERVNHTFVAFVLIALSVLAVLASVLVSLPAATGC
jgi:rhomboid protease GluP